MKLRTPFLLSGWLAAAAVALAATTPKSRQPNPINGPLYILSQER